MKAKESRLLDFLRSAQQFVIPIYQRPYRWDEKECGKLWDDIMRAARGSGASGHFIGSVVYIQDGLFSVTDHPALLVIDGQQRLTTCMLLIEAIARAQTGHEMKGDFEPRRMRHAYLKDAMQDDDRAYKMLLSATDRSTLKAVVDGDDLPVDRSVRIVENFVFFQRKLAGADLEEVCRGLSRILIVDIALDRGHDNPQLIFESLNSTGKALAQSDLIRNYVLMGLPPREQDRLYERHWRPMEIAFGQEAYAAHFDSFMRHFLTMRTGAIPRIDEVYEDFKAYAASEEENGATTATIIAEVHRFAGFYCRLALGKQETDRDLADALKDLRDLKADVTFPFLLELYGDLEAGVLGREDFLAATRLVEAYVFRRVICDVPTNSHNKTFATFSRSLIKGRYLESIAAHFVSLPSYRRFPSDAEFEAAMKTRELYNARTSYWLRRMENHGRRERVAVEKLTIEHILPQTENLSPQWREALGSECDMIAARYRHTIGNLTLTAYNSEMSARWFVDKRDIEGGLGRSPLRLNSGLGSLETWNENTIRDRADRLAQMAVGIWAGPVIDADAAKDLLLETILETGYGLADYPALLSGRIAPIYRNLRSRLLELDPAVTETFRKLYVQFLAETTFVSVIPRTDRLRLVLNMPFPELQDARGMCRDVTEIGHWSTGDVDLDVMPDSDISYVVGLVRQAYEWQIAEPGA